MPSITMTGTQPAKTADEMPPDQPSPGKAPQNVALCRQPPPPSLSSSSPAAAASSAAVLAAAVQLTARRQLGVSRAGHAARTQRWLSKSLHAAFLRELCRGRRSRSTADDTMPDIDMEMTW